MSIKNQLEALDRNTRNVRRNTSFLLTSVIFWFVAMQFSILVLNNSMLSMFLFFCLMVDLLLFIANGLWLENKGRRIVSGNDWR